MGKRKGEPAPVISITAARATKTITRARALREISDAATNRTDGWESMLMGLGTERDKRKHTWHTVYLSVRDEQEQMWRANDLFAKAVETEPDEMLRKGFTLDIASLDPDEPKEADRTDAFPPQQAPSGKGAPSGQGAPSTSAGQGARAMPPPAPPPQGAGPFVPKQNPNPKPIDPRGTKERIVAGKLAQKWKDLGGHAKFKEALQYENAYGGSAIFLGADDGETDLTRPLNLDAIRDISFLNVLTPRELYTVAYYTNPREAKYGEPEIYRVMPEMLAGPAAVGGDWNGTGAPARSGSMIFDIHESRLLVFPGIIVSKNQRRAQAGWGDSKLNRLKNVLRDFGIGWESAATLLSDFAQAVYAIKNFAKLVGTNGEKVIQERVRMMDMARSSLRAMIIDADGESFERKQTPLTGLPELLDRLLMRLAMAMDEPVSRLSRQASGGLGSSGAGDTDIRYWYDGITSKQEHHVTPHLERLFRVIFRSETGPTDGKEPGKWTIKHAPLWQLDEMQEAQRRLAVAQADQIHVTIGMVTPEEAAASRFGGDKYSGETSIDFDGREEMAAAVDEQNEAAEDAHNAAKAEIGAAVPTTEQVPPARPPEPAPDGNVVDAADRRERT